MLSIRMAVAGALLMTPLASAAAQSTIEAMPGAPIPLLKILQAPNQTKPARIKPRVRAAANPLAAKPDTAPRKRSPYMRSAAGPVPAKPIRTTWRLHRAPERPTEPSAPARAKSTAEERTTPAALPKFGNAARPAAARTRVAAAQPVPQATPSVSDAAPSALLVQGQTVQIAEADAPSPLDLAADAPKDLVEPAPTAELVPTAVQTVAAKPVSPGMPTAAAAAAINASSKPDGDAAAPAVKVFVAAQAPRPASPVGSVSWIAQVLAALGGAVAAGSVAWFMIGSAPAPQRRYG